MCFSRALGHEEDACILTGQQKVSSNFHKHLSISITHTANVILTSVLLLLLSLNSNFCFMQNEANTTCTLIQESSVFHPANILCDIPAVSLNHHSHLITVLIHGAEDRSTA